MRNRSLRSAASQKKTESIFSLGIPLLPHPIGRSSLTKAPSCPASAVATLSRLAPFRKDDGLGEADGPECGRHVILYFEQAIQTREHEDFPNLGL